MKMVFCVMVFALFILAGCTQPLTQVAPQPDLEGTVRAVVDAQMAQLEPTVDVEGAVQATLTALPVTAQPTVDLAQAVQATMTALVPDATATPDVEGAVRATLTAMTPTATPASSRQKLLDPNDYAVGDLPTDIGTDLIVQSGGFIEATRDNAEIRLDSLQLEAPFVLYLDADLGSYCNTEIRLVTDDPAQSIVLLQREGRLRFGTGEVLIATGYTRRTTLVLSVEGGVAKLHADAGDTFLGSEPVTEGAVYHTLEITGLRTQDPSTNWDGQAIYGVTVGQQ